MFGIFQRKKICSVCGTSSDITKIVIFDPTNRGEFKESEVGKKEFLCIGCLKERWQEFLKKYNGVAVCYLPLKGYNSYSYITLERAKEWALKDQEIEVLQNIVSAHQNAKCSKCSGRGNFLLYNYPYKSTRVLENQETPTPLCGKCFCERIIQEIEFQGLKIDEINTPFGEKGIYMHGEY